MGGPWPETTHSTDWAIVAAWEIRITNWKVSLCSHFDKVLWALCVLSSQSCECISYFGYVTTLYCVDLWGYVVNLPPVAGQVILLKHSATVCLSQLVSILLFYGTNKFRPPLFFSIFEPVFAHATSCHSQASPCFRGHFLPVVGFRIFSNSPSVGASLCGLHTSSSVAAPLVVLTPVVQSAVLRQCVSLNTDCILRNVCVFNTASL